MCGIVGFFSGASIADPDIICKQMVQRLRHRGPDDSGVWIKKESGIALGHSRLSIRDLSPAGHQPMFSHCERFVIIFNGEIYNHIELRKEIETKNLSPNWRGHSDTETLLTAIAIWGVEDALKRCVGMFSLAVWDNKDRKLILARDRMGEKPLYYGWQGNTFLFGSELKALKVHPSFQNKIDRGALCLLLRHNAISSPYSIYQGIKKLPSGSILILKAGTKDPSISSYWSVKHAAETGIVNPFCGTDQEALLELERVMSESVADQMIADVPLGAFLSGGVDSSTIVALMCARASKPVKTYSIGFNEEGYDEARFAKKIAQHLGTDHTELYVTDKQALDVIPKLPSMFDEPFSDSSQIPTFLVAQLAKQSVTVSLSGDGGDELFGGYNRHFMGKSIWNKSTYIPTSIRKLLGNVLISIPPEKWNRIFQSLSPILPNRYRVNFPEDKIRKLADILLVNSPESMYRTLVSHWKTPENIVREAVEPDTVIMERSKWMNILDFEYRMMFLDTVSYLPDDILTKVDRAAMSVSLETRIPMLDHRVVEFAWKLPLDMKIRNGVGKWLLRQLLYKYVPKKLIERPKMGFGVPIDSWLRGSLRNWGESLLDESRLRQEGYFDPLPIRKKWDEHITGKRNWQYHLWDILMFQAWLEETR